MDEQEISEEIKITFEQANKTQRLLHHLNSKSIVITNHCSSLQWFFADEELNTEGANQTFTYLNDTIKLVHEELKILSDFLRDDFDIKGDFEKGE